MIHRTQEEKEAILEIAMTLKIPVKILYEKDNEETTIRNIVPLKFTDHDTNILAACGLRDEPRKFKIERIKAIQH